MAACPSATGAAAPPTAVGNGAPPSPAAIASADAFGAASVRLVQVASVLIEPQLSRSAGGGRRAVSERTARSGAAQAGDAVRYRNEPRVPERSLVPSPPRVRRSGSPRSVRTRVMCVSAVPG
jgi:hypothetical protein